MSLKGAASGPGNRLRLRHHALRFPRQGSDGGIKHDREGESDVAMERIPRSFWSYTAGKGSVEAEERDAKRAHMVQAFKENLPGVLGLLLVLFLTTVMLLMMFSEFRGCYIWQLKCLIGNVPLLEFLS